MHTIHPALADLRARWRPSDEQIARANERLIDSPDGVITLHLLVNKRPSIWNADVKVIHLEGTYTSRTIALAILVTEAHHHYATTGETVIGGWTNHFPGGEWAVFDDALAVFPEPEYRRKES